MLSGHIDDDDEYSDDVKMYFQQTPKMGARHNGYNEKDSPLSDPAMQ